jgi:hypothetical protein
MGMTAWQPYREPLRTTLTRTIGIALIGGLVLASFWGGLTRWPLASVLMLWPSFGGHWLEIGFLNWLRPHLPEGRAIHAAARLGVWFAGGIFFLYAMRLTAVALTGFPRAVRLEWWAAGLAFIGVELVAQSALHLRGRPSFFDGRG